MTTIGLKIRTRRKALGLTQEQLAIKAGMSKQSVYLIEKKGQRILLDNFLEVCKALDCSVDTILSS